MHRNFVVTLSALAVAGCSVFGDRSGYEQPAYDVVAQVDDVVEIRRYDRRLAAEAVIPPDTTDNSRAAFSLLFDYISGENRQTTDNIASVSQSPAISSQKIAMTTPVQSARLQSGSYVMRFFLPPSFALDTAPKPMDSRVKLVELPTQTIAVLSFSGARDRARIELQEDILLEKLKETKWQPTGPASAYLYDPPWTLPFLRLNEIAVPVAQKPSRDGGELRSAVEEK